MLALHHTHDPFEESITNAQYVARLENLYAWIKKQIKFAMFAVVVFLLLPLVFPLAFLSGVWLLFQRKSFKKRMKFNVTQFNNYQDYSKFRTNLDKLSKMTPRLYTISKHTTKKAPIGFKFLVVQMRKMSITLLDFECWSKKQLESYNVPQFKSSTTNIIEFKSEDQLWNKRNHNYKYWM